MDQRAELWPNGSPSSWRKRLERGKRHDGTAAAITQELPEITLLPGDGKRFTRISRGVRLALERAPLGLRRGLT